MTSAQMKAAFKIMQDFAPAIMKATEILEAVESAESVLAEKDKSVKAMDKACVEACARHEAMQKEIAACQVEVDQAKVDTAAQKAELAKTLKGTQEKLKAAQEALDATQKEHANTLALHRQELSDLDTTIEKSRKDLADFRRAIPKTYSRSRDYGTEHVYAYKHRGRGLSRRYGEIGAPTDCWYCHCGRHGCGHYL